MILHVLHSTFLIHWFLSLDFLVDEDLFAPDEYLEGEYDAGRMSDASMSLEMGREVCKSSGNKSNFFTCTL